MRDLQNLRAVRTADDPDDICAGVVAENSSRGFVDRNTGQHVAGDFEYARTFSQQRYQIEVQVVRKVAEEYSHQQFAEYCWLAQAACDE